MEYWKIEELKSLTRDFIKALQKKTPDFDRAKDLLNRGVSINATDSFGDSVLCECLLNLSCFPPECDFCEIETCKTCENNGKAQLIPIIDFFIDNGWDTVTYGLNVIASLVHTTHDSQMFYAAKRILECPLSEKPEDYEAALESIGTEESFQRCCEECHEQENLYYAMYEIVDAKMNNRPFEGIFPYYQSLGKKVDRIVYFADKLDFKETPRGTEFNSDFGFICGDAVIVITSNINILLMNNRAFEEPKTDISESVGEDIIGSTIVDISFEHQNITKDKTRYGQPTIILKFDNGKELRFTHNFGELTNKETQARFLTSEAFDMLIEHRDCLFDMCANVSIDLDKIEAFIVGAKMSLDDITKTAIKLVEKFSDEVSVFRSENEREPKTNELISSNWMDLFRLFLTYGLDSNSVYREDEGNYKNLLHCLTWLDNTDIVYKLFRLLLKNGANPNVCLDDESLFEHIDEHVVLDATLMEIEGEDRQTYEKDFRLWLLLMSYGGHLSNWGKIVQIKDNYDIDMFENCEAFSYKKEVASDDWYLHIYITKTGEEVAVL